MVHYYQDEQAMSLAACQSLDLCHTMLKEMAAKVLDDGKHLDTEPWMCDSPIGSNSLVENFLSLAPSDEFF